MSTLRVTNLKGGSAGSAPNLPDGAVISGVITATSFSGSGANLTGIDATALKDGSGNVKIQANSDGAVVTGVLTVSSNVSVGGTLTYEDVTNVDSVGLITARDGIHITGNIGLGGATYGSSGQVLTSGGSGANATWTTISAAPETTGVVNGTLADGNPVSVDADGKFSITKKTVNANDPLTFSSEFNGAEASNNIKTFWNVYDPNLKMVLVIYDDENDGHKMNVSVGNVNAALGNASWARTIVTNTNRGYNCAGTWVGNTAGQSEWIATSVDNSNQGWVHCGSTDGSTVSTYGSLGAIQLGNGTDKNVHWDPDSGGGPIKIVTDTSSTQNRTALLFWKMTSGKLSSAFATLNGPSDFTWGSVVRANEDRATGDGDSGYDLCYDSGNNKFVAVYSDETDDLFAQVATRSGANTVTWATPVEISANKTGTLSICYHEATGKVVCAYQDKTQSNNGYAVVGTVSGTTTTWGTPVQFSSDNVRVSKLRYDPNTENMVITYNNAGNNYDIKAISATVSGNSISFGTAATVTSSGASNSDGIWHGLAYDTSAERFLVSYEDSNNKGKNKLINAGNATTNLSSFIGFSNGAYTNGQTATVALSGAVDDAQVGLTTGTSYYVQKNGSLKSTADTPSIKAGVALASNKLLIRS